MGPKPSDLRGCHCKTWKIPNIDLFASRLNYKCKLYVSDQPDQGAFAINAFQLSWNSLNFYALPPFCIIQKVLHKIQQDGATELPVVLVPYWPTQAWTELFYSTINGMKM